MERRVSRARSSRIILGVTVAALALACGNAGPSADDAADTIYRGGPIVTVDDATPTAEAIAVKDGRIMAVGGEADVMGLRGSETVVVDLAGRTLAPGFVDGHAHVAQFGTQAVGANLLAPPDGDVNTIDDIVTKLQEFAAGPDLERTGWIFGMGYDDALLGRHPTRDDLDRVSTDVPVLAIHISGHFAAMNSAGLAASGYSAETADPEGGVIRRRAGSREPNGVLEELAAIPAMMAAIAPPTPDDARYFLERGIEMAKSYGYTTAQEGRAFASTHESLAAYADTKGFDIDVVSYIDYSNRDLIDGPWHSRDYRNGYRIGGLKITLDGSPQGRTAWRTIPYLIPPDGQEAGYRGYPAIPDDDVVAALFNEAYDKNWQVLTHTNGDAAVDQLIRTMRPAHDSHPEADRRHVMIHGQLIRTDQLDSLRVLNVIPSLFPMHTFYWGDWYDQIIGPERAQQISPMRSAINRGMTPTSHTDAPVALPNLLNVMDATVNRTSRSGKVMGPDERTTPLEALKAVTLWGAYQHFEEDRKGSIEVGKLADLVILSANPLTVPTPDIGDILVMETIKEGRTVWKRQ